MAKAEEKRTIPVVDVAMAVEIAAGLLSSASVSHREPANIAEMAVKQVRAIMEAVDKANA